MGDYGNFDLITDCNWEFLFDECEAAFNGTMASTSTADSKTDKKQSVCLCSSLHSIYIIYLVSKATKKNTKVFCELSNFFQHF